MTIDAAGPPVLTVVRSPACHYCSDAETALERLAGEHALRVRYVELDSAEGQELVRVHRPGMNPLVLLDGAFFSQGRLPRRKLRAVLERRATSRRVAAAGGAAGLLGTNGARSTGIATAEDPTQDRTG